MLFKKKLSTPKQIDQYLDQQSKLLSSLSNNNGTLAGQIESYEYALLIADPPLQNATAHELKLAELYIKAEQHDKAWGYLNRMYSNHMKEGRDAFWRIRDLQAKILKKEGKYAEAIEMYLLKYAEKSCDYNDQKDAILKDIKPCANKLKWDEKQIEKIIHIISKECGKFNAGKVTKEYRKIIR